MRVHQIITGSCNGDYSHIAQTKVRGSNYIVYASGCDVVILNEAFCRSQVISGRELGNSVVTSVAFNHQDGKIAVANADGIYIYVPQETVEGLLTSSSKLLWTFSVHLTLPCKVEVICLCWSHRPSFQSPNCVLLAGLENGNIFMWRSNELKSISSVTPRFHIGNDLIGLEGDNKDPEPVLQGSTPDSKSKWKIVWYHQLKGTPLQIDFSTDGLYFASITQYKDKSNHCNRSNVIHIWFHDPYFEMSQLKQNYNEHLRITENWESILLPHPCNVYSFSWRCTSRYLPSGWIPNALLTAGEDNLCRVWVEVTHPSSHHSSLSTDGGNPSLFKPTTKSDSETQDLNTIVSNVKLRLPLNSIPTELKHKVNCELNKEVKTDLLDGKYELSSSNDYITLELPECFLRHPLLRHFLDLWLTDPLTRVEVDYMSTFPKSEVNSNGIKLNLAQNFSFPQFTFTTALPLDNFPEISTVNNSSQIGQFTAHWFNNKEYRFNTQLESFMMDTISRILAIPVHISCENTSPSSLNVSITPPELLDQIALMDQIVLRLFSELQHSPDVVFAIHPLDGSFIVWYIHGLDVSVPNPKGLRTHKVLVPHESGRDTKFGCESAFTLIPNMGNRLTQVTCSVRSRLHQAIPLDAAYSISSRLFTYLTMDSLKRKMNHLQQSNNLQIVPDNTTTTNNNVSSIHRNENAKSLSTINYQDNLDIFCHLFLLKYSISQVLIQFSKQSIRTANNIKMLDQLKQRQLKPMLSFLAEIQLNSTTFASRIQNSSHIAMITMHTNGSLRYWRIDVSEYSHYQWIVGISGCSRLSGHRFHTSTIVPHPLLPLALTTSHYECRLRKSKYSTDNNQYHVINYNEIILWYVSSVGALTTGYTSSVLSNSQSCCSKHSKDLYIHQLLSNTCQTSTNTAIYDKDDDQFTSEIIKSYYMSTTDISTSGNITSHGGISEVARLNFSNTSNTSLTFKHIAWFPCMLTTMATIYPVALFVASLDTTTEIHSSSSSSSVDDENGSDQLGLFLTFSKFKHIYSDTTTTSSSSSRERVDESSYDTRQLLHSSTKSDTLGCIIQLDYELPFSSQLKDYQSYNAETLLLHVFPSELIMMKSEDCLLKTNRMSVVLHNDNVIENCDILGLSTFLIVRMTRYTLITEENSLSINKSDFCRMEMWRVRVSTDAKSCSSDGNSFKHFTTTGKAQQLPDNFTKFNNLITDAVKVCDCKLHLPLGVSIICAQVSAAHVSWAALSTFNAPPPYLIVSACSDGCLRFWRCYECDTTTYSPSKKFNNKCLNQFTWDEWQMPLMESMSSCIELQLNTTKNDSVISSNIELMKPIILDMDCAYSGRLAVAYTSPSLFTSSNANEQLEYNVIRNKADMPIYVTIYECESSGGCEWILEDTIEFTSKFLLHNDTHKLSLQLDWVNTEDGGHLLSVIIDSEIFIFAPICQNVNLTHNKLRGHLYQPTLMTTLGEVYIGWKLIACTHIITANFPTSSSSLILNESNPVKFSQQQQQSYWLHSSNKKDTNRHGHKKAAWLRDGLLLVGAKTEMQLFSQWPSDNVFNLFNWHVKVESHHDNAYITNTTTTILRQHQYSTVSGCASMSVARLAKVYSACALKSSPSKSMLHMDSQTNLSNLVHTSNLVNGNQKKSTITDAKDHHHCQMSGEMSQIDLSCTMGGLDVKSNEQILKDVELLSNLGLFESIQIVNPVLPQFHPRQLLEWMNLGRLRRIKAILAHLNRCLSALGSTSSSSAQHGRRSSISHRRMTKGNLNSELTNFAMDSFNTTTTTIPTGKTSTTVTSQSHTSYSSRNLLEAEAIPPLPLYILLAVDSLQMSDVNADIESSKHFDPINEWSEIGSIDESKIFEIQDDDFNRNLDEEVDEGDSSRNFKQSKHQSLLNHSMEKITQLYGFSIWSLKPAALARSIQFSEEDARSLADHLSTRQLPGLSPLDQMYLLGIADLMAKTHSDITDCLSEASVTHSSYDNKHYPLLTKQASIKDGSKQGLDECGLRFLLTVQLYSYLSKTLPPGRRAQLLASGLTTSSLVWAYHSDSEEELLSCLPIVTNPSIGINNDTSELNWPDFKRYGCGWWIRSESLLIRCAEKMARTAFQSTKDPMEAAVFYLAMHKAKMVAALFKTTGNKTLENFFRLDFTSGQPASGCLDDAIRVCLDTLKDLQLGILLVRLYTSSVQGISGHITTSAYHDFLRKYLVQHEDPFLRSMAFWSLGDPLAALQTLLEGPGISASPVDSIGSTRKDSVTQSIQQSPQHPRHLSGNEYCLPGSSTTSVCPSVFKFYTYLQSHPLVLRQQRIQASTSIDSSAIYRVKSLERRLYFRTAHHYFVLGCPTLALEVLTKLPPLEVITSSITDMRRMSGADTITTSRRQSELLTGYVQPVMEKKQSIPSGNDSNLFTLSYDDPFQEYTTSKDEFTIQWSDDEDVKPNDEHLVDNEPRSNDIPVNRKLSQQQPSFQSVNDFSFEGQGVVDLIANQLKFIACLKILAEELSTLAAGAESEGVSLRQHVWQWLENELAVVNSLTGLSKFNPSELNDERSIENTLRYPAENSEFSGPLTTTSYLLTTKTAGSVLAGIFMSLSSVSLEIRDAELKRLKTRYDWIKAHETFLSSLINFCDLYGSSGIRLPAVRIELSLLLSELYTSTYLFTNQSTLHNSTFKSDSNLLAYGNTSGCHLPDSCWPISTMALIDGIPLLRTVMRLSPGALLLPHSVKRIKHMVHDLITCLELLPPPFLVNLLLPYPVHQHQYNNRRTKSYNSTSSSNSYCPDCILAPTGDRHRRIFLLRNLCAALSACIHQCLSVGGWLGLGYVIDENSITNSSLTKVFALPATSTINIRSVDRLCVSGQTFRPNTEPAKWPGLTCLKNYTDPLTNNKPMHTSQLSRITSAQSLSDRESLSSTLIQCVDRRRLIGLLAQALAASYFGLLVYALYTRDACTLYRLACTHLDAKIWSRVFGGTYRAKPFRPPTQPGIGVTFNINSEKKIPPPKPPIRPKRSTEVSTNEERSQSKSPEKTVMRARDRAVAALEVASKIGSPPKYSVLTSQHIRFLAHAEASAIADSKRDTIRSDNSENTKISTTEQSTTPTQSLSSISPDEWFIFAQSSILSCLLERPPIQTDLIDDPSQVFDSDADSESFTTSEYNTFEKALVKQQHRIHRIQRFIKHSHIVKQRKMFNIE
ncbi:unnamed protein product [Heterobilharzia americana]|nr:unnamed protein product [Heterobilharzia americana]